MPANFSVHRAVESSISFTMRMNPDGQTVWKPEGQSTVKRSVAQLIKLLPDWFCFESAWMIMLKAMTDAAQLEQSELPALRLHMQVLRSIAKRMGSVGWGLFLELQQELACLAHQHAWPLDREAGYIDQFTVMSYLAKAAANSVAVGGGVQVGGAGSGVQSIPPKAVKPQLGFQGNTFRQPKVCFAFHETGVCSYGTTCKWGGSHYCASCGSPSHGTGQCNHAKHKFGGMAGGSSAYTAGSAYGAGSSNMHAVGGSANAGSANAGRG